MNCVTLRPYRFGSVASVREWLFPSVAAYVPAKRAPACSFAAASAPGIHVASAISPRRNKAALLLRSEADKKLMPIPWSGDSSSQEL